VFLNQCSHCSLRDTYTEWVYLDIATGKCFSQCCHKREYRNTVCIIVESEVLGVFVVCISRFFLLLSEIPDFKMYVFVQPLLLFFKCLASIL
jgi:hypothetical protein